MGTSLGEGRKYGLPAKKLILNHFGAALLGSVGCGDQTFSQIRQIASGLPARVWHPCTNEQIETAKRTYCARRDMIDQCFHYR